MLLTAEETRVLGCLIEKQLTTPQQYPLTESALVAACNQATNRDPLVAYDQDVVRRALVSLRQQGLARTVHRPGDRTDKHRHLFDEALQLDQAEVAVLAVLMLRGAQTVGELRTRTERMHAFETLTQVEAVLRCLEERGLVERLERQPGQKEVRYRQGLSEATAEQPVSAAAESDPDRRAPRPVIDVVALGEEVRALRADVDDLREVVQRLCRELGLDATRHAPPT